jgi:hypothetical protein
LRLAKKSADRAGAKIYFVYLPSAARVLNGPLGDERYRDRVLSIARSAQFKIIDLVEPFKQHSHPSSLFYSHYSEAGNQLVADHILKVLAEP